MGRRGGRQSQLLFPVDGGAEPVGTVTPGVRREYPRGAPMEFNEPSAASAEIPIRVHLDALFGAMIPISFTPLVRQFLYTQDHLTLRPHPSVRGSADCCHGNSLPDAIVKRAEAT